MFLFSLLISLVSVLCTLLIWRTRSVHLGTSLWSCPISGLMCVCVYTVIITVLVLVIDLVLFKQKAGGRGTHVTSSANEAG